MLTIRPPVPRWQRNAATVALLVGLGVAAERVVVAAGSGTMVARHPTLVYLQAAMAFGAGLCLFFAATYDGRAGSRRAFAAVALALVFLFAVAETQPRWTGRTANPESQVPSPAGEVLVWMRAVTSYPRSGARSRYLNSAVRSDSKIASDCQSSSSNPAFRPVR